MVGALGLRFSTGMGAMGASVGCLFRGYGKSCHITASTPDAGRDVCRSRSFRLFSDAARCSFVSNLCGGVFLHHTFAFNHKERGRCSSTSSRSGCGLGSFVLSPTFVRRLCLVFCKVDAKARRVVCLGSGDKHASNNVQRFGTCYKFRGCPT